MKKACYSWGCYNNAEILVMAHAALSVRKLVSCSLKLSFNDKGVSVAGLCAVGITRAVKTANLFATVGRTGQNLHLR